MDCNKRICNASSHDQISKLPDDILVSIVSLLTLKEAGRTSVLSTRWRYLWTFFNGKMDFVDDEWQKIKWPKLLRRINEIFKLHKSGSVERFRVTFDKVGPHKCINKWIAFAAKKRVRTFELKLRDFNMQPRFLNRWSFESLRVLRLVHVNVCHEVVNYLILKSPNLEMLELDQVRDLSSVLVPSSCTRLNNIAVVHCPHLRKIEICSSSLQVLEVFTCLRYETYIEIKDVHGLHSLNFGFGNKHSLCKVIAQLWRSIPLCQVEILSLDFTLVVDYHLVDIKNFSLPKVRYLNLTIAPREGNGILNCIYLLEAAPVLHTFSIGFHWAFELRGQALEIFYRNRLKPNRCIKVVKVQQYMGLREVDAKFVKILVENMESLEKVVVYPYRPHPKAPLPHGIEKQKDDNIVKLSEKGFLPPGVKLVDGDQVLGSRPNVEYVYVAYNQ